jgi:hypothetical protein
MTGDGFQSGGVIISIYAPDTDPDEVLTIAQRAADAIVEDLPDDELEFQVNVQVVVTTYGRAPA